MKSSSPIYFDNAATSWPKPFGVLSAVQNALQRQGGNPGRGGHLLSERAGNLVYQTRELIADFFGTEPEYVVFTQNCTHALNLALYGVLHKDDHVIISDMEHNSVARPLAAMAARGFCTYSVAATDANDALTLERFRQCITPKTRAIVCTLVSNVTGQILPYREIAALCRQYGLLFIADGAQACGILPVTLRDGINILCTAGHKGLYGIMGTGLLVTDGSVAIKPLMQGGTGSLSANLVQPDFLPDALEAGTVNVPGIAALQAGIKWIRQYGLPQLHQKEEALCQRFLHGLQKLPHAVIDRRAGGVYAPVVSFAMKEESAADTAARLHDKGFCLRAGLHCAPLAHKALGTMDGTVRFAPSVFNTAAQVDALLHALRQQ
ncbi:MAG: aminotransferase class V-fold PLP-dependent enzyme [Oscillospiraceae bacterium]|nr:aminotransferase class V-fold PLP-dependent enzyme [Oscillospiraceae bacterium]